MAVLPLDKPAGVLVKTTLVDFPGRIAGSFFLKGCNLRCPYCYNKDLVYNSTGESQNLNTIEELFEHLEKRAGILTGLVISGGEPIINPYTPLIIQKAKSLGYKIKIDTNGTLPDELEYFLNSSELSPDFVAMDFKTTFEKYSQLICNKSSPFFGRTSYFKNKIVDSINLLKKLPAHQREWRTVLVPGLVTLEDIQQMALYLPEDASWQFAQFQNGGCLDPNFDTVFPYTDQEINKIIEAAKEIIPNATLR